MVDIVWNNDNELNHVTIPKHLMVQETSNRRESLLSPRRTKQSRGINCKSSSSMLFFLSSSSNFRLSEIFVNFSFPIHMKEENFFFLYLHITSMAKQKS
jgi:hypothetical protein